MAVSLRCSLRIVAPLYEQLFGAGAVLSRDQKVGSPRPVYASLVMSDFVIQGFKIKGTLYAPVFRLGSG
jgi:hypothetical protein